MSSNKSQTVAILSWLMQGQRLTALEAIRRFGCNRLAARVNDIQNGRGVPQTNVSRRMVKEGDKRYAEYYIPVPKVQGELWDAMEARR